MLTTRRISRARLAGGAATVALVGAVALGLTASGTQAAEHVRVKVETVTGVDLDGLDQDASFAPFARFKPFARFTPFVPLSPAHPVKASTDHVPRSSEVRAPAIYVEPPRSADDVVEPARSPDIYVEPPRAPDGSVQPPAAPLPPAPPRTVAASEKIVIVDGREVRHHVARIDHGAITTADSFADLPQVISTNCGGGAERPLVIHDQQSGTRRITVCNDRIARANARADVMAARGVAMQRNAYRSALAGLRKARTNISGNVNMAAENRREALASLDQSIAEIEADAARAN